MLLDMLSYLYQNLIRADQRPGKDAYNRYDELTRKLRARPRISSHFGTPIHPVWLRCSSGIYLDIIHSSRLARRAPRRPKMGTYFWPDPTAIVYPAREPVKIVGRAKPLCRRSFSRNESHRRPGYGVLREVALRSPEVQKALRWSIETGT